ncbi:MAG: hypothetical protein ACXWQ5_14295 [Ktedonobacterales bacterium]
MSLDDQLTEILTQLGVVLEEPTSGQHEQSDKRARYEYGVRRLDSGTSTDGSGKPSPSATGEDDNSDPIEDDPSIEAMAEISLFQTSREHYGVFYRLDLVGGLPHLRVFMPEDEGALKMRCYLARATLGSPLHDWFLSTRAHDGSQAYEDARDTAQQHLLFAAGELMKRLFWTGEIEQMRFPDEIDVLRLA